MKGSSLIIPFSVGAHLVVINTTLYLLTPNTYLHILAIIGYNASWLLTAIGLNFYTIERKERFSTKFHKFLRHYLIFSLAYFSIFSILKIEFSLSYQLHVLGFLLFILIFYRWFFFTVRRLYRIGGGNYINVVVIGKDGNTKKIEEIFKEPDFGYRYHGYFHNSKSEDADYLGDVESCYDFILNKNVEEVYCFASQISSEELHKLISFADNNLKRLKLVPDNKGISTRAMHAELFENIPVINLRQLPLERNYAKYGKRIFDIIFSSLVIIFILSWLCPILYIITRFESKDTLFFKQVRHGYNKQIFLCYKFRSMRNNSMAHTKMCTKNDSRITRIGRVLRKTSMDELPQFFNVFKGEMSVVGPRPHMEMHTMEYSKSIDKYLVRHFAKPGVTGLAQIKGYRGEITNKADIVNRTRFDIFYLEKWTPGLDLSIIATTIKQIILGEEKAY